MLPGRFASATRRDRAGGPRWRYHASPDETRRANRLARSRRTPVGIAVAAAMTTTSADRAAPAAPYVRATSNIVADNPPPRMGAPARHLPKGSARNRKAARSQYAAAIAAAIPAAGIPAISAATRLSAIPSAGFPTARAIAGTALTALLSPSARVAAAAGLVPTARPATHIGASLRLAIRGSGNAVRDENGPALSSVSAIALGPNVRGNRQSGSCKQRHAEAGFRQVDHRHLGHQNGERYSI